MNSKGHKIPVHLLIPGEHGLDLMMALSELGFNVRRSGGSPNPKDHSAHWAQDEVVVLAAAYSKTLLPAVIAIATGPVIEVPDDISECDLLSAINVALQQRTHLHAV